MPTATVKNTCIDSSRWTIFSMRPEEKGEILSLFTSAFGQTMSESLWQWKYGDGRGQATVARDATGQMVAHYGGLTRSIQFKGESATAVQICDVMVAPEQRGILTKKGPFFLVTAKFLDLHIGFGRKHLLGFGFPSNRHLRLAEKQGLYSKVGTINEVSWPPLNKLPWRYIATPIDWNHSATNATLDALWFDMQSSLLDEIIPVRDSSWWRYRYFSHPEISYSVYWVKDRLTRRTVGSFVSKSDATGNWELIDWVSPKARASLIVTIARGLAGKGGATRVSGWFSEQVTSLITGGTGEITNIGVGVPTNIRTDGPSVDLLLGHWWLTGGDTDFR